MRKKHQHINKILAVILLWAFSIALTPWSAFHNHVEENHLCKNETHCMHKLHVSNHTDRCLICAAHFEKNFVNTRAFYRVYLTAKLFIIEKAVVPGTYTELIGSSLRGPPLS